MHRNGIGITGVAQVFWWLCIYRMDKSLNLLSLTSNVPASLQTPLGDPEFVKLPAKHQCLICHKVMRDAVMTLCGHRMCEGCLTPLLFDPQNKEPVHCPGKEEFCIELKPDEIRGDNGTRREIRKLSVFCTFKAHGCPEKLPWKDLMTHESQCKYKPIPCPHTGCELQCSEDKMEAHVKNCDYRPVRCSYCEETIPFCLQADHQNNTCRKAIISCPYKCDHGPGAREEIEIHMQTCQLRPQECKFKSMGCQFVGSERDMQKHNKDAADEHLQMITMYTASMDLQSMEMRRELQDISAERDTFQHIMESIQRDSRMLKDLVESIKVGQKELKLKIVEKTERIIHLEKKVDDSAKKEVVDKLERDVQSVKDRQISLAERVNQIERSGFTGGGTGSQQNLQETTGPLVTQIQQHDRQLGLQDIRLAELDLRFQVLETASYSGILMWKIRDYSRRKQEAISGRTVSLYSQPFYTSRFGYKMCARLYLNGDGMGKGTHLSLFFVVMRGEYDALLPWPFQQKVTLLLLDQDAGARHVSDTFRPDPTSTSFKRPTSDMNIASGCPLFVSHAVLETRTYLKDDTIFIKVTVDNDGINAQG
ncbi:TNF receptor-associated factor 3 [Mytilus galloprovincialis]|uniref:TNF receptor-associated factor 3 n=1 Tax=Mytilus galloprovincialis TaxID=29158 RepID=A0A8B6E4C6_MYTGA|nr:TNF receptor-associated factor 3 [Mytilus galloprovincialis]